MSDISPIEIGCCSAYCKTCRAFRDGHCRGCRLGYDDGRRDINKAKCKIKVCCMTEQKQATCADCRRFSSCAVLNAWYAKNGAKYKRYKKSAEFIRRHGYEEFVQIADQWKDASGKLPDEKR